MCACMCVSEAEFHIWIRLKPNGGKYDGDTDPTDTTNPSDDGGNGGEKIIMTILIRL